VKLLLRTSRHVAPTDAGRAFLKRARQILGDLDGMQKLSRRCTRTIRHAASPARTTSVKPNSADPPIAATRSG
jgi:DNA-binding transcriptional LysR family regulator